MNPILKNELKTGSRTMKYPIFFTLYSCILALLVVAFIVSMNANYYMCGSVDVQKLIVIFYRLCWILFGIICIMVPATTAAAISGERERQTLDMMLTTKLSARQIIFGKISSGLVIIMIFVIISIPIMAISLTYGGIEWINLFWFVCIIGVQCVLFGCISVCCSVVIKKTIGAIVLAYILELVMIAGPYILTYIISMIVSGLNNIYQHDAQANQWWYLLLVGNPVVAVQQFLKCAIGSAGIEQKIIVQEGSKTLQETIRIFWIPATLIWELLLSYLLYRFAAHWLNPLKPHKPKKEKQVKEKQNAKKSVGIISVQPLADDSI